MGVPKDVAERLDASGVKWRVNGRYVASRKCVFADTDNMLQVCVGLVHAASMIR